MHYVRCKVAMYRNYLYQSSSGEGARSLIPWGDTIDGENSIYEGADGNNGERPSKW